MVNHVSAASKGKRKGSLKYGTCVVRVNSVEHAQRLFGAMQELGGFSDPALAG